MCQETTTYGFPPEQLPRSALQKRWWARSHPQMASGWPAASQPAPICGRMRAAARQEPRKRQGAPCQPPTSPAGFHRSSGDATNFPASAPSGGHPPAAELGARHLAGTGLFFGAGKSTEIHRMRTCLWRICRSCMSQYYTPHVQKEHKAIWSCIHYKLAKHFVSNRIISVNSYLKTTFVLLRRNCGLRLYQSSRVRVKSAMYMAPDECFTIHNRGKLGCKQRSQRGGKQNNPGESCLVQGASH